MPNVSPEKVRTPAGSDAYALTNDLRLMGDSVRTFVPVSNVTERAAVVTAMTAASRPVTANNPLVVIRADAPTGAEVEYTLNGTVWAVLGGSPAATVATFSSGWGVVTPDTPEHRPRCVRSGNIVTLYGMVARTTGTMGDILTIPLAYQPPSSGTRSVGTVVGSNGQIAGLFLSAGKLVMAPGYGNLGSTGGNFSMPLGGLSWVMD